MSRIASFTTFAAIGTIAAGAWAFATPGASDDASACAAASSCGASPTVALAAVGPKSIVETAVEAGTFTTLAAALDAAGLVSTLEGDGPFTVFAPTDAAFAKLPHGTLDTLLKPENKGVLQSILTYHVVPGELTAADVLARTSLTTASGQRADIRLDGAAMIDGATIVTTDIECSNGIIHVIDRVILPESNSILEAAAEAGSFGTLAAALKSAGLVHTLQGDGPFTVFAPTDAAFAKLPAGTVTSLLKPENRDQLVKILTYHVVPGRIFAADALGAQSAVTVEGQRVRFTLSGDGMRVNGASVIQPDIETTNGVIHVIDEVILPPSS